MEKDLDIEIAQVHESDVPALIQNQFEKMNDYKTNLTVAKKKANKANEIAIKAKNRKVGVLSMKSAIETIQDTQVILAEATLQNTEAQEKSYEYQQVLADITKYLFGLGVTNIAVNRCVVKELEMRINHASEEEIDDMAKEELVNVVRQLKAQEDVLKKQYDLSMKLKEYEIKLISQEEKDVLKNEAIARLEEQNQELKNRIIENERKNEESLKKTKLGFGIALGFVGILAIAGLAIALIHFFG